MAAAGVLNWSVVFGLGFWVFFGLRLYCTNIWDFGSFSSALSLLGFFWASLLYLDF